MLQFTGQALFWCAIVGLAVTAFIVVITEYYTGVGFRPVRSIAQSSVTGHGTNVIQGLAVSLESTALPTIVIIAGIIVAFKLAGLFGIAIAVTAMLACCRHDRGARCLRSGDRQRRRHRRNGGSAEGGPQVDGRSRRGRQHHEGGDEGLRHRLGRPRRPGAVRRLHLGPELLHAERGAVSVLPGRGAGLLADQSLCGGRPAVRRPDPVPLRRHRHDGGGPRGGRGGRGSAPSVPREAGHHGGHGPSRLRPRGRHADPRCDQGDDRAVAAAGAGADRDLLRGLLDRRQVRRPSRPWAPCCSA